MREVSLEEIALSVGVTAGTVAYRLRKGNDVHAPRAGTYKHYLGKEYGKLKIIGIGKKDKNKHQTVICECECGAEKTVTLKHIKSGRVESCGCAHLETLSKGTAPKFVDVFGVRVSIGQLAAMAGRRPVAIWARLRRGMSPEAAAFGKSERDET